MHVGVDIAAVVNVTHDVPLHSIITTTLFAMSLASLEERLLGRRPLLTKMSPPAAGIGRGSRPHDRLTVKPLVSD